MWQLYGVRGWGSALAEGALAWTGTHYVFHDVSGFDQPGEAHERLKAINPLARVPTLVTPGGEVLTESAAIVLHLGELHPDAELCPRPDDPQRAIFLDRLLWFVSTLYPTFTYRDYPERWVSDAPDQLVASVDAFRRSLWAKFEQQLGDGPFVLGKKPSALDLYVTVMSHWRPRRAWVQAHCTKLYRIAVQAEQLPALAPIMARNFA